VSGDDPQRTGWNRTENELSAGNVTLLKLEWSVKLDSQPNGLTGPINGKVLVGNNGPYGWAAMASESLRLAKRFQRTDADTIQYQVTVDDPQTLTKPWTLSFPLRHEPVIRN
jgi:hypothetical protein